MRVYVRLYATLVRRVPDSIAQRIPQDVRAGTRLQIELPEGSTLVDLTRHLELAEDEIRTVFVNGRAQKLDYRLHPEDEVGIFPPVGGG